MNRLLKATALAIILSMGFWEESLADTADEADHSDIPTSRALVHVRTETEAEKTERMIQSLYTERMDEQNRRLLGIAIKGISVRERDDIIRLARLVFPADSMGHGRGSLLKSIKNIPEGQREEIIDLALPLFTRNMDERGRGDMLTAINEIDRAERVGACRLVQSLRSEFMDGRQVQSIFTVLLKMPQGSERDELVRLGTSLCAKTNNPKSIGDLLFFLKNIDATERGEVVRLAEPLFVEHMNEEDIESILTAVQQINRDDLPEVIGLSQPLFTVDMGMMDRAAILTTIRDVGNRAGFINAAQSLIRRAMTGHDIAAIVCQLGRHCSRRGENVEELVREVLVMLEAELANHNMTEPLIFARMMVFIEDPHTRFSDDGVAGQEAVSAEREEIYRAYRDLSNAPEHAAKIRAFLQTPGAY